LGTFSSILLKLPVDKQNEILSLSSALLLVRKLDVTRDVIEKTKRQFRVLNEQFTSDSAMFPTVFLSFIAKGFNPFWAVNDEGLLVRIADLIKDDRLLSGMIHRFPYQPEMCVRIGIDPLY